MNKPKTDPATPESTPSPAESPAKRSAMKLPANMVPKGSQGPRPRQLWEGGANGKPQTDAARRAGKSRKVH